MRSNGLRILQRRIFGIERRCLSDVHNMRRPPTCHKCRAGRTSPASGHGASHCDATSCSTCSSTTNRQPSKGSSRFGTFVSSDSVISMPAFRPCRAPDAGGVRERPSSARLCFWLRSVGLSRVLCAMCLLQFCDCAFLPLKIKSCRGGVLSAVRTWLNYYCCKSVGSLGFANRPMPTAFDADAHAEYPIPQHRDKL